MQGIVGQDRALQQLQAALVSGRLAHACVFHGPFGVGKFTTAVALARVILCHQPRRGFQAGCAWLTACGECPSCRFFASRGLSSEAQPAHPDLHIVNRELARFHEDPSIRERKLLNIPWQVLQQFLLEPVYLKSHLGHGKVFIVDEAELIDPGGQNRLLKTLEEPPADTYIILVTSAEERLLPTVRSRCQRVAFAPLPIDTLRRWLEGQSAAEKLSPAQRSWILEYASGSLGRLKLALDYELWRWAGIVLPALEQMEKGRLPPDLGAQMSQGLQEFARLWVERHENASREAANRLGAGLMLALIAQYACRCIESLASGGAGSSRLEGQRQRLERWVGVLEAIRLIEAELGANLNLSLVCDHLVLKVFEALRAPAAVS